MATWFLEIGEAERLSRGETSILITLSIFQSFKRTRYTHLVSAMANYKIVHDGFDTTAEHSNTGNKETMDDEQTEDDEDVTGVYGSATDGDATDFQAEESSENATMEETYEDESTSNVNTSRGDSCDEGVTVRTINYGPSTWARADEGPAAGELLVNDSFLDHSSGATLDDDENEFTVGPTQRNLGVPADVDVTDITPPISAGNTSTDPSGYITGVWNWGMAAGTQAGNNTEGNATRTTHLETELENRSEMEIILADNTCSQRECSTLNDNVDATDQNQDAVGNNEGGEELPERSPFLPKTENPGCLENETDKSNTMETDAGNSQIADDVAECGETNGSPNSMHDKSLGDKHLKRLRRNEGRIVRAEGRLRSVSEPSFSPAGP